MTVLDFTKRLGLGPVSATVLAAAAGLVVLAAAALLTRAPGVAAAALALAAAAALVVWLSQAGPGAAAAAAAPADAEAEPPYVLALEGLSDPVMLAAGGEPALATEPRLVFANAAARELLRLPRRGGLLAAAIRNPAVLEALEEALHGRVEAQAEFEEGGALGRVWRARARPLPSESGQRLALLWLHDETDARRNERMRADFLANASHELRTPLASLAGFIETLRGHAKDDAEARDRFLAIMAQQADRMSRLIDDLLSLSRIELNEHIAPSGTVVLARTVNDVLDALGPLAAERHVRIDVRMPPAGQTEVAGDRDQLIQVIQNLVDNAIKFAGDGGVVTVEIVAGVSAEDAVAPRSPGAARLSLLSPDRAEGGRYAVLRVTDSGPGIAREHLPRLSERFYRVEGQKTGLRGGTGLGLAIVKHIVNRHRGGLLVESTEGEGSTFTAYVPMLKPPPPGPQASA